MEMPRMRGRSWLVRRAEKRLGPQLGNLVHVAAARRIRWSWFLPCLLIGFIYGVISQFIAAPRTTDTTPDRFGNIPLFIAVSALTGLVLWLLTFAMAFRKLLVFDGGLAASFSTEYSTRIFRWSQLHPASIQAVAARDGDSPSALLVARDLHTLGVRARYAVIFRAASSDLDPIEGSGPVPAGGRFWTFESNDDPAPLVQAIQAGMVNARVPGAELILSQALPPHVLTSRTALD
jgi:hypothetical protein